MQMTTVQRTNILACIGVAASTLRVDASDEALARHATLVQLRREVEGATIDPAAPQSVADAERAIGGPALVGVA